MKYDDVVVHCVPFHDDVVMKITKIHFVVVVVA